MSTTTTVNQQIPKNSDVDPERSEISHVSGPKQNISSVTNKAPQATTNNNTTEKMIVVQPTEYRKRWKPSQS